MRNFLCLVWLLKALSAPEPCEQRQDDAEEDAGGEGEVEPEIAVLVGDVPGQFAEPTHTTPGPEPGADQGKDDSGDEEYFAEVLHWGSITELPNFPN